MSIKTSDKKGLESGIALLSGVSAGQNGVTSFGENLSFRLGPGLLQDAIEFLRLDRSLGGRSQLQLLNWADLGSSASPVIGPHTFFHTRLEHSLRVAFGNQFMGKGKMSERDLVISALAGLLHDMWLLPGGDSWKSVNQQKAVAGQLSMYDEDDGFMQKMLQLSRKEWRRLCKAHNLDAQNTLQEVQSIIWGNGLRGQIQEIADTASYMLGDLAEIGKIADRGGADFGNLLSFARDNSWDIWYYTHRVDDGVVILKPEVLENFLWLRALLWGDLYNAPGAKFLEILMRKVVYPHLVDEQMLDLKGMLKQDDGALWTVVEDVFGWPRDSVYNLNLFGGWPMRVEFPSKKELLEYEEGLRSKGCFTLVAEPGDFQAAKSKTGKYNVLDSNGKAVPYNQGFPVQSAAIEKEIEANANTRLFQLYYVGSPQNITPQFEQAWVKAVKRWRLE